MAPVRDDTELVAAHRRLDAEQLLSEWLEWWKNTDDAPIKMPKALHVRTRLFLLEADLSKEDVDVR